MESATASQEKVYLVLGEGELGQDDTSASRDSFVQEEGQNNVFCDLASTTVVPSDKVSSAVAVDANDDNADDPRKKSVCDPDYATPSKSTGGGFSLLDNPVKRKLVFPFNNQKKNVIKEQVGHHPQAHHVKRKKKKKKRSSNTLIVVGSGNKVREVIASSSTSSSIFAEQGTSGESAGQKEHSKSSEESVLSNCGVGNIGGENKDNNKGEPLRRIAQLVVWTKNPPTTSSSSTSKKTAESRQQKHPPTKEENQAASSSGKTKQHPPPQIKEENTTTADSTTNKEAELKAPEGDLFIVQYPVRPFSDQGKGKNKPFRRLNSYNDPIVIKKTPPPPPPSTKRRGGGGGQKRKRGVTDNTCSTNKENRGTKERSSVVSAVEGVSISECGGIGEGTIFVDATAADLQGTAYTAYLQQLFLQNHQYSQQPQEYYYHPPQEGGEVIFPLLPPQFVQGEEVAITQEFVPANLNEEGGEIVFTTSSTIAAVGKDPGDVVEPPAFLLSTEGGELSVVAPEKAEEVAPGGGREEGGVGVSGGEYTIFDLPDRFTVTTTDSSSNEFDLLIQNVVHEEMVDGMDAGAYGGGEEDSMERLRKRMKLSCEESCSRGVDSSGMTSGVIPAEEDPLLPQGEDSERGGVGGSNGGPDESGKPRCTYTELIEKALTESGGLTVSEIYNWISERYPYYRQDDDRWKNSVRHNLSINPYFKKGEKARSGAGHLWTISEESKALRPSAMVSWDERRKTPCDPSDLHLSMDNATDRAVANILGMYRSECNKAAEKEKTVDGVSTQQPVEPQQQQQPQLVPPLHSTDTLASGVTCNNVITTSPSSSSAALEASTATFTLNELNTGQFTVDLSGITIPEGGAINFDELVSNGRLIYIQTAEPAADPEANKENEEQSRNLTTTGQQSSLLLNAENILSELSSSLPNGGGGPGSQGHQQQQQQLGMDEQARRFSSYFGGDALSLDLAGFGGDGKVESLHQSMSFVGGASDDFTSTATSTSHTTTCSSPVVTELTMVPPADVVAPTPHSTTSLHDAHLQSHHHQDMALLEQVLHPLSTYEVLSSPSSTTLCGGISAAEHTQLSSLMSTDTAAALYESKELGLSYTTYQMEPLSSSENQHDLL